MYSYAQENNKSRHGRGVPRKLHKSGSTVKEVCSSPFHVQVSSCDMLKKPKELGVFCYAVRLMTWLLHLQICSSPFHVSSCDMVKKPTEQGVFCYKVLQHGFCICKLYAPETIQNLSKLTSSTVAYFPLTIEVSKQLVMDHAVPHSLAKQPDPH